MTTVINLLTKLLHVVTLWDFLGYLLNEAVFVLQHQLAFVSRQGISGWVKDETTR